MFRHALLALVLASFAVPVRSQADPIALTSDGNALGFTLSTFASGFPTANHQGHLIGPLGVGFPTGNGVLVSDYFGNVRVFPSHADGQNAAAVPIGGSYGTAFGSMGITNLGGNLYMANALNGTVVQISATGAQVQVVATGIPVARDVAVNPLTGRLLVSGQNGIYDLNPLTGAKTLVVGGQTDGIAVAGNILYAAHGFTGSNWNSIQGFDISNGYLQVFDTGPSGIIPGVDGVAVGTGSLSGKLYANTNFGEVWQISLSNPANRVLIANGGSRGDFVVVDPTNGTLLLTQTDRVVRLTAPAGGGFGTAAAVPEPAAMAVVGLLGLGTLALRRRNRNAAHS